jgi:hypothetical protein
MSYVRFEREWQYNGCRVLRLESDLLRVDVLPEVGGRIWSLVHKPEDREYLWHHPRIKPAVVPPGTGYDDTFAGGWDELFPSDSLCRHEGETYPDHGEYWTRTLDWALEREGDACTVHLSAEGAVTPTRMERWITLQAGSPVVRLQYRLTHLGEHAFDYMWKLHPALRVGSSHEILIPGGAARIAAAGCGRLSSDRTDFVWPHAPGGPGDTVDLAHIPATSGVPGWEMVYVTELHAGWCGVLDHATRSGLGIAFDRDLFNNVWLFQSFGGWRGLNNLAILEPSTAFPYDLAEAARSGRIARLEPGQVLETQVTAVVFTGREGIEDIALDGQVS